MLVAGLDEVGWGAAAGPLVSVVVVMKDADYLLIPKGVTDSKKLTALRREAFFNQLYAAVTDKGIGAVFPDEIDRMSPKWALQESYKRALGELKCVPDKLIVDGTEWTNMVKSWKGPQVVVPKADLHHVEVSVASILAKVIRDRVMADLARKFKKNGWPDYGWEKNSGYLTPSHIQAIHKYGLLYGPDPELYQHRRTYTSDLLGKVKQYGCA
jgi:ribonuclease HII